MKTTNEQALDILRPFVKGKIEEVLIDQSNPNPTIYLATAIKAIEIALNSKNEEKT